MTGTRWFLPHNLLTAAAKSEIIRQTNLWCHSVADIHDWDILCVWPLIKAQVTFEGILQLKQNRKKNKSSKFHMRKRWCDYFLFFEK